MPIIKAGFSPGFRGRTKAPACNRRMHYLASEHDRDSARLLGAEGQELTPDQAAEVLGGPQASYREIIVAPSQAECEAIRARCPEDPDRAAREAEDRLAKAYAKGRPYVLAIHEQDGRFHYHLAVAGPMPERALGRHGQMQKTWDREFYGDEPRIQDWAAHRRFQQERAHLQEVIRAQKENDQEHREAVQRAALERKAEAARPFDRKARELVEQRHQVELRAIRARYEARGSLGSPRHQAEVEQAAHRRTGALRRLERRESAREIGAVKAKLGRAVETGGRALQKTTRSGGRIARQAVDLGLKSLGLAMLDPIYLDTMKEPKSQVPVLQDLVVTLSRWETVRVRSITEGKSTVTLDDFIARGGYVMNCEDSDALKGPVHVFWAMLLGRLRNRPEGASKILLLLDEFGDCGRIANIQRALVLLRSKDVAIVAGIQNLGLLQDVYPQDWKAVMEGFGTRIWLARNLEDELRERLSKALGKFTRRVPPANKNAKETEKEADLMPLDVWGRLSELRVALGRLHGFTYWFPVPIEIPRTPLGEVLPGGDPWADSEAEAQAAAQDALKAIDLPAWCLQVPAGAAAASPEPGPVPRDEKEDWL